MFNRKRGNVIEVMSLRNRLDMTSISQWPFSYCSVIILFLKFQQDFCQHCNGIILKTEFAMVVGARVNTNEQAERGIVAVGTCYELGIGFLPAEISFYQRQWQKVVMTGEEWEKLMETLLLHLINERLQMGNWDSLSWNFLAFFPVIPQVHNRVATCSDHRIPPVAFNGHELAKDVATLLQRSSSDNAQELKQLLESPSLRAILLTHDQVAKKDFTPDLPELIHEIDDDEETVKIVQLVKSNEPLGATIKYDDKNGTIVIARVLHGGAADRSGLIHVGDEVHEVNGINIRGKSPRDVVNILQYRDGPITFKLVPKEICLPARESRLRVRAHFCYDPNSDKLIPCKEAGLPFAKGDILHIVNQEDLNWWQARKHGEKNSRAGLIPSRQLQERRFAEMRDLTSKQIDEFMTGCKIHIRKDCRPRKIKKIMYDAKENDDFDREEIATYEEVAKLYPRPGLHRPIILVGPPGVGRNELKRRLIASNPDHYRTTIPHTSRSRNPWEIDGQEYFFHTREAVLADIKAGRFVEHGEYKGNFYGTSLETVKSIVNAGYVCVMTPHPQALKVLRTPEIKPYLIFIKPPSLDILKETRMQSNARSTFDEFCARGFTENEFQEIVFLGQKLEFLYGHMFDAVIVNDDLRQAFQELLCIAQMVESVPQWVPASWVASS